MADQGHRDFQSGSDYGKRLGREEGYRDAFVAIERMLEVEHERTKTIADKVTVRMIQSKAKELKKIIIL